MRDRALLAMADPIESELRDRAQVLRREFLRPRVEAILQFRDGVDRKTPHHLVHVRTSCYVAFFLHALIVGQDLLEGRILPLQGPQVDDVHSEDRGDFDVGHLLGQEARRRVMALADLLKLPRASPLFPVLVLINEILDGEFAAQPPVEWARPRPWTEAKPGRHERGRGEGLVHSRKLSLVSKYGSS